MGDNQQTTPYELLSADDPAKILESLVDMKVCQPSESVSTVTKAGEGNMNLVLRLKTDQRSVIVKQARPWVEKYPSIAAPDERILSEIDFYRCVSGAAEVSGAMPRIIASNTTQRLLVLEDLGTASDYVSLYSSDTEQSEVDAVFDQAIAWVTQLHACDVEDNQSIGCTPLRSLNQQHIFSIPLADPPATDLDLVCDGLTQVSRAVCADTDVQNAMESLGKIYLAGGGVLLHGDYYPGSWLKTDAGFRVIDPEFCFCGPQEFDLGVLAAHLIFCGSDPDESSIDQVCKKAGTDGASRQLVMGFAGAELIRRLIGVAQLPLDADLQLRTRWLECGIRCLKASV